MLNLMILDKLSPQGSILRALVVSLNNVREACLNREWEVGQTVALFGGRGFYDELFDWLVCAVILISSHFPNSLPAWGIIGAQAKKYPALASGRKGVRGEYNSIFVKPIFGNVHKSPFFRVIVSQGAV
jgi:hypothetical protein